jgi:preprotein translocase subunit SecD
MRGYRLWSVVIIAIAIISVWMSIGNHHISFLGMNKDIKVVQGLDLQGGSRVLLQVAPGTQYDNSTMDQAKKNVERRVNGLGVTDAVVQRQGSDRIIVELPGVKEQQVAFDSIKSTGLLEFVDFSMVSGSGIPDGSCILTTEQVALAEARLPEGEAPKPYDQYTCASTDPNSTVEEPALLDNGQPYQTIMTGAGLSDAAATTTGSIGSQWAVRFVIKKGGDRVNDFITYVADNANKPMAIVLDGRLLSYPVIQAGLSQSAAAGTMDGGVITGNFTHTEAQILAAQLKYGALPVPLDIVAFDTIGPSLGEVSVQRSIRAGIIGVIAVLTFMLLY